MSKHAAEPDPDVEPQEIQVDYELGYNDEVGAYQVGIETEGVKMLALIKPEGFALVDTMLAAFHQGVPELLETLLEQVEEEMAKVDAPALTETPTTALPPEPDPDPATITTLLPHEVV